MLMPFWKSFFTCKIVALLINTALWHYLNIKNFTWEDQMLKQCYIFHIALLGVNSAIWSSYRTGNNDLYHPSASCHSEIAYSICNHICSISFDYGFKCYYFHNKSRSKLNDMMDLLSFKPISIAHFNGYCIMKVMEF